MNHSLVSLPPARSSLLGYRHPEYARSFAQFGALHELEHAGGWVLQRPIPGTTNHDAMGLYPLFSCRDWRALPADLSVLRGMGLVSLVLVSDPLLSDEEKKAFRHFDMVRPFKTHYLARLDRPIDETVSRHHRYCVRKAAKALDVEVSITPLAHLDEWCSLFASLAARYSISDLRGFSREAFRTQLAMPGVVFFRALKRGQAVGAQIILIQDDIAYAHLAAFTDEGYRHGASYLLDWEALKHLSGRARYLNWGGGTGLDNADCSGLARYKQGWSTENHVAYLLGAVLNQNAYARLSGITATEDSSYFPSYRAGEFA